ncbi:FAD-dependent oxidoreductase [Paeniglutamicibacter sulfureus]|uniref:Pyruvate/2-oxoglutarate dehydrogenase complex dihydrolipoamide dehydrogenase (E3) component n=1 Tax=Paeniglutamicibacter sulfureus TaxID=43666 RepID=A0ABU2BKR6_9MICC|nr:FAD-dependent oxidoreductase [Paeniglutamicibacter sulfureus]MDR7359237.1 pyruvate/2-oxoglutarate dehydrogenase complex dihydrolipoamide dehydrogenase (E3) component [Paeniglutamicibacter sulfureus]
MEHEIDLIVIGWGKGGKTLAGTMARAGHRVAIIEASPDMYGGTCINIGCVPTKALIHDADIRPGNGFDPGYFDEAVRRRDKLSAAMRAKNFFMLDGLDSVITITGRASFVSPRRIRVVAGEEILELDAKRIIINTGAVPAIPDLDGVQIGGRIHDSTTLQHAPLPGTLVVVGGGYVGTEFASMFAHFGSKVIVLDRGPRALKEEDEDIAAEVLGALNDVGVEVRVGASVQRIGQDADSAMVHYEQDGHVRAIEADAVLIALGRTPVTDGLNLEAAGIELTESGAIKVEERLSTSAEGVYALGDVNGGPQFTYVSLDDNRVVADAILGSGQRSTADRVAVPYTIFTTPPLARVGLSEDQARSRGLAIKIAVKKVPEIAAMPRPKIVGDPRGIIKFVVDADSDRILGAALMHVDSQEVINLVALAMRQGVTSATLRDSIFTHPSSTEALNEVLGSFNR